MSVIDFIENDSKKIKCERKYHIALFLVFGIVSLAVGYGTRIDFKEAFQLHNLVPSMILLGISFVFHFLIFKMKSLWAKAGLFLAFLIVSLSQVQTSISLQKFQNPSFYWDENIHCLEIGLFGGGAVVILFVTIMLKFMPALNQNKIFLYGFVAAFAPTFLLSLHCPGPLRSHIAVSHWGASLIVFVAQSFLMSMVMSKKIKSLV